MGPALTPSARLGSVTDGHLRRALVLVPAAAACWWLLWRAALALPPAGWSLLDRAAPGSPEWLLTPVYAGPSLVVGLGLHRLLLAARGLAGAAPMQARCLMAVVAAGGAWWAAWLLMPLLPAVLERTPAAPAAGGLPGYGLPEARAAAGGIMAVLWAVLLGAAVRAWRATGAPSAGAVYTPSAGDVPAAPPPAGTDQAPREHPSGPEGSAPYEGVPPVPPHDVLTEPAPPAAGSGTAATPVRARSPAGMGQGGAAAIPSRLGWLAQRGAVVAIDLAYGSAKVLQAVRRGERLAVTAATRLVLPPAVYRRGQIADPAALAAILREALRSLRVTSRRVVAVVGGEASFLRTVPFPRMTEDELREALRWESDKYFPFRYEEAVVDFRILDLSARQLWPPGRAPEGQIPVLLGACPRDVAAPFAAVAEQVGLELVELEPHPLAAFRAWSFLAGRDRAAGILALVDLGLEGTCITVFKHGAPLMHRSLGRCVFAPGVRERGSLAAEPDRALAEQVTAEVRRSLEAAAMQLRARRLRVLLTGDGAAGGEAAATLADHLRDTLPGAAPDDGAVRVFGVERPDALVGDLPEPLWLELPAWAGALGLALRGLGLPVPRPPVVEEADEAAAAAAEGSGGPR